MPKATPHTRNLRKGRWSKPSHIYVVTFVTDNRINWFEDLYLARAVIKCLNKCPDTQTLAFVVMPNHVHWMIQISGERTLAKIVQASKSSSAHAINRLAKRKGKIWQPGFHDHAVRNEKALREIARYLVANPLRAKLVRSVKDYPFWDAIWI